MAQKMIALALVLAMVATLLTQQVTAQSPPSCTASIISLLPCLSFTSGTTSVPSSSCCSALSSIVQTTPSCLCTVLAGGASSFGVTINNTRALELPGSCKVETPPVSECNAVGHPVAAPTESPTTTTPSANLDNPAMSPAASTTSVGAGSKATPSTTITESSDGSMSKSSTISIFFILAFASLMVF